MWRRGLEKRRSARCGGRCEWKNCRRVGRDTSGSGYGRRRSASQRGEGAEPVFAQVKSSPDQHAKNDWEVERLTGAHVGNSCAAKIGGQQNGAEDRGRRNHVED